MHDLFGRRGDDVEIEAVTVDSAREQPDQRADVALEADPLPHLDEVLTSHPAELGIVPQQVRQFGTLLHQVETRQSAHLRLEAGDAEHLAQHQAGVVEAQRLIEVADEQVPSRCHKLSLTMSGYEEPPARPEVRRAFRRSFTTRVPTPTSPGRAAGKAGTSRTSGA